MVPAGCRECRGGPSEVSLTAWHTIAVAAGARLCCRCKQTAASNPADMACSPQALWRKQCVGMARCSSALPQSLATSMATSGLHAAAPSPMTSTIVQPALRHESL